FRNTHADLASSRKMRYDLRKFRSYPHAPRKRRAKSNPKPLAGKRYPLNMRTTREVREQIDRAATASGRSLVQEVEYRLEMSFAGDPLVKALTGGGEMALRLIAVAMQYETAAEDGTPWKDDAGKAEAVRTAAHLIIAGITG